MPKPMNKEMGGKPKMSGDQMKVLGRVMKYMLKNYKFSFIIVVEQSNEIYAQKL